ncbi:MAG: hypothetical protein KGN34_17135 [Sphingomonadales bacterium]|nr:hypothetical protein [Sphingomonadales bacterium]
MKAIRDPAKARRLIRQGVAAVALLELLGSCTGPAPTPPPAPLAAPPPPRPTTRPAAPVAQRWQDMPLAAGDWRWSNEGGNSTARFGLPGLTLLTLTCRTDHTVAMTRTLPAAQTNGAPLTMIVHAGGSDRPLAAQAVPGGATVAMAPRDPLLDAIAFARGRFAVEVQGADTLALPSWPEVARVIDDCR